MRAASSFPEQALNMATSPALSVVLPCYNEAKGLEALLARFAETSGSTSFELILVDNGSVDDTPQVLARLLPKYPFARSVRVAKNQGYGHGIWTGLQAARSEVLAWSHADLQTDPADIFHAWRIFRASPTPQRTLVKGSRHGRSWSERFISWGMQTFATLVLRTRLTEINAQPKMFHRDLLACLSNPPIDLNFDVYVLYAARKCGWRLASFPVAFPPRQHGHSSWATSWRSKLRTISRSMRYIVRLAHEPAPTPPASLSATGIARSRPAA
jgi:glycosyltransferase involved in cell wall biosynthesis